jgi:hypothetical protein
MAAIEPFDQFAIESESLTDPVKWATKIYAKPMHLTQELTSKITISVERKKQAQTFSHESTNMPLWRYGEFVSPP